LVLKKIIKKKNQEENDLFEDYNYTSESLESDNEEEGKNEILCIKESGSELAKEDRFEQDFQFDGIFFFIIA